jgi:hypothetical protein
MVRKPTKTGRASTPAKKRATAPVRKPARAATPKPAAAVRALRPPPPVAKPTVVFVGADKGGVGKSTVARAVLDFLALNDFEARAFDTEAPKGTLQRFHPDETTIVDLTATADQMKIIDTLMASKARVSVIDVRAGGLSGALSALEEIGFFEAVRSGEFGFVLLHVIGPSIASLDEIAAIAPYVADAHYFIVKNHVNDTTFFEWDLQTHAKYFEDVTASGEITIPRLRERAYEEVELAGTPFSKFIENRTAEGDPADHSFVLRGYVRSWLERVADEFERAGLLELLGPGER